jgi:hypothetical protein
MGLGEESPIEIVQQRDRQRRKHMSNGIDSQLWAVLADWVKIILTLPDPPPDQLVQLNDVAILTAVSALTARLSPDVGSELRKALPSIQARLKTAA